MYNKILNKSIKLAYWAIITSPSTYKIYEKFDFEDIIIPNKEEIEAKIKQDENLISNIICPFYSRKKDLIRQAIMTEMEKNGVSSKNFYLQTVPTNLIGQQFGAGTSFMLTKNGLEKFNLMLVESPYTMLKSKGFFKNQLNFLGITNEDYELNESIKPIVQHEIGHIKNNDSFRTIAFCLASPFLNHYLFKTLKIINFSKNGHILNNLANLPKSLLVASSAKISQIFYNKYTEMKADDFIEDEPDNLRHAIKKFEGYQNDLQENRKYIIEESYPDYKDLILKLDKQFPTLVESFLIDSDHPTIKFRINRFQKRLNKLTGLYNKVQNENEILEFPIYLNCLDV